MNSEIQTFYGHCLVEYPTARVTSSDVKLEAPEQYYDLDTLKEYIKFLKGIKKQLKEAQQLNAHLSGDL